MTDEIDLEILSSSLAEQEYITQFLGFAPQAFVDTMYNIAFDSTWQSVHDAQMLLSTKFPDVMSEEQLQSASEKIMETVHKGIDKGFDIFETHLMANLLCLPQNITLPEDQIQEQRQCSQADEDQLNSEIKEIKEKIHAALYVKANLKKEIKECDTVQAEYDKFQNLLKGTDTICKQSGVADTWESLNFSAKNLLKIDDLLKKVQGQIVFGEEKDDVDLCCCEFTPTQDSTSSL